MADVCVITGGGSGMGLEAAKILCAQGYHIVIAGRTLSKLQAAVDEIEKTGGKADAFACDVSDRQSTKALSAFASSKGKVMAVIHAAGLSPHMGDPLKIMKGNALGTININDSFYGVISSGGCIIDVSSMSAYLTPSFIMPVKAYPLCRKNMDSFLKKMMKRVNLFPKKTRSGVAYGISKHFVIWYARTDAARFGEKNVRVISITPGNFETPMGNLEKDEASTYLKFNAIKRFGKPEEIARLFAYLIDPRLGYLTGTDIICDGGCIASGKGAFSR